MLGLAKRTGALGTTVAVELVTRDYRQPALADGGEKIRQWPMMKSGGGVTGGERSLRL
jgi:hypothetical protein